MPLTDVYVPLGATEFRVTDASGFAEGDAICIARNSTKGWIRDLGMDQLSADGCTDWEHEE